MIYEIVPNEITKISETSGTIQNVSQINKVELSADTSFASNIILYPLQQISFDRQLYARLFDNKDLSVELRVVGFQVGAGTGGGTSSTDIPGNVASNSEFNEMIDEIFPPAKGEEILSDNDSITGDIASDDEFNSMLDDLGL